MSDVPALGVVGVGYRGQGGCDVVGGVLGLAVVAGSPDGWIPPMPPSRGVPPLHAGRAGGEITLGHASRGTPDAGDRWEARLRCSRTREALLRAQEGEPDAGA